MSRAKSICFDIETYHTRTAALVERITQEAINKRPARNAAKDVKAVWDTEKARDERARDAWDKTAVDVLLAEVLCCAWIADIDGEHQDAYIAGMGTSDEKTALGILAETWDDDAGPDTIWIGHNVLGFDLPILLNRWRHHKIQPPEHFPTYRNGRWRGRVYDTMKNCPCQNGLGLVSLDATREAYGLGPAKTLDWDGIPMDGSRVGQAFEAGEFDLIVEYCRADVAAELELYKPMTFHGVYGAWDDDDDVAEQLAEIDAASLSEGQRAIAKLTVLEQAGRVPRATAA